MNKLLILVIFSLVACSSIEKPYCIIEKSDEVIINWGDYNLKEKKMIRGYSLNTNMEVHELINMDDSLGVEVAVINDTTYCNVYRTLKKTMVETQKLSVRADTIRFIEYKNPETGFRLVGLWNNKLKAVGSEKYREVFDMLNEITPIKFEK